MTFKSCDGYMLTAMRLPLKSLVARCCWNQRSKLIIAALLCTVCFLVWYSPQVEDVNKDKSDGHNQHVTFLRSITFQTENDRNSLRRQNVIDQCKTLLGESWTATAIKLPRFGESPIISRRHNLMYCPVGKVASTFFTRLVQAMNASGPMASPLDIPIERAGRDRCDSLQVLGSEVQIVNFLQHSTKVVFGRNPFSRIYSAYIDKLFSPNPIYWALWGQKALQLNTTSTGETACASEVTFQQFLHLVIVNLHRNDVHLRQVYTECHMCHIVYDVIGKLETAVEDIDYLLQKLNVSSSFQHESSYTLASKMDIVHDSVNSTFAWKADIAKCISLDEMGLRLWRKLQIRGVLDSSLPFPFRPGEMDNVLSSTFTDACKKAILMSTDEKKLKKQKKQALIEAYKTVNYQDLVAVGRVYKDDFNMFGYDSRPSDIFTQPINMTGSLNWQDSWIL